MSDTDAINITVTPVNDTPVLAQIASGSGLSFDGNDYINVASSASLTVTDKLTMEAWIFPKIGGDATQIIMNKEGEYELARFSDGTINWAFTNATLGWVWISTGYVAPALQWTHLAVTYDAGVINTYANGALVHSYAGAGNIGDTYPLLNDFTIGGRQNTTSQRFVGLLDDVRVWTVRAAEQKSRQISMRPWWVTRRDWRRAGNSMRDPARSSSTRRAITTMAPWAAERRSTSLAG